MGQTKYYGGNIPMRWSSDLMSNVMLDTADDSILITSLVNPQVIRASEDDGRT